MLPFFLPLLLFLALVGSFTAPYTVPVIPEKYGPLSLINGMIFWDAEVSHRLMEYTIHNEMPTLDVTGIPDSVCHLLNGLEQNSELLVFMNEFFMHRGDETKPTKKDDKACKHMEMDLLVQVAKEIFLLQASVHNKDLVDKEEFAAKIKTVCESNAAFLGNIENANQRAVSKMNLLASLKVLREKLASLEYKKGDDMTAWELEYFKPEIYLEAGFSNMFGKFEPFLVPKKLMDLVRLLELADENDIPPKVIAQIVKICEVATIKDSKTMAIKYQGIRDWLQRNYPEISNIPCKRPNIAAALGKSPVLKDLKSLEDGIKKEISNYPISNDASKIFSAIMDKMCFGTILYGMERDELNLLGESFLEELKTLDFQISRHKWQLEMLDNLIENFSTLLTMTAADEEIWKNLEVFSKATFEAVNSLPSVLPRTTVLSLWLSYIYARFPNCVQAYYDELSLVLRIDFGARDHVSLLPFYQTPMTMKDLEDAYFTFDGDNQVLHTYQHQEQVNQEFQGLSFPVCVEESVYHFIKAILFDVSSGKVNGFEKDFTEFCQMIQNQKYLVYASLIVGGKSLEAGTESEQHRFHSPSGFAHRSAMSNWEGYERGQLQLQAFYTPEMMVFETVKVGDEVYLLYGDDDVAYEVAPMIGNVLLLIDLAVGTGLFKDTEMFINNVSEFITSFAEMSGINLSYTLNLGRHKLVHVKDGIMKSFLETSIGHAKAGTGSLRKVASHDLILSEFRSDPLKFYENPARLNYLLYFIRASTPGNLHGLKKLLYRGKHVLIECGNDFVDRDVNNIRDPAIVVDVLEQFTSLGSTEELIQALKRSDALTDQLSFVLTCLPSESFTKLYSEHQFYQEAFGLLGVSSQLELLPALPDPIPMLARILKKHRSTITKRRGNLITLIQSVTTCWDQVLASDNGTIAASPLMAPFYSAYTKLKEMGVENPSEGLKHALEVKKVDNRPAIVSLLDEIGLDHVVDSKNMTPLEEYLSRQVTSF